jgi:hypothetical protein
MDRPNHLICRIILRSVFPVALLSFIHRYFHNMLCTGFMIVIENKTGNVCIMVILRHVRVTIFDVEKQ